jgi:uroporphyrinogen-III synthase
MTGGLGGAPVALPHRRIIVTRPAEQASSWVDPLRAAGWAAESLPLLEIAPLLGPGERRAAQQRLQGCYAVMFVSGNAVDHFLQGWSGPGLDSSLRWLASGPGTAARLRAFGVPPAQIDEPPADAGQFDSEALWHAIAHRPWAGRRVLLVRGRSGPPGAGTGRQWLADQLEQAGAQVDAIVVYERRAPDWSPTDRQRIKTACGDGSLWLFSSSEAIAHLPADIDCSAALALATHPRIAQAAQARGFAQVWQSRPALPDVMASIKSASHE